MISVRKLRPADVPHIREVTGGAAWDNSPAKWSRYLKEQRAGERVVLVAASPGGIAGYGSLKWKSGYPPFVGKAIPEISDLVVAAKSRRRGTGTQLIRALEEVARQAGCTRAGIGVGLYGNYGPAQRLYVRLGYVPDGHGITYKSAPVAGGTTVPVDDELVLWLMKDL